MNSYDVPLKKLKLNLNHFRIMPQSDEEGVLLALAKDSSCGLSELSESFLNHGYLPLEPLVVIARPDDWFLVIDGNRRVAVLKHAHGLLEGEGSGLPERRMGHSRREATWRIPCLVFTPERKREAYTLAAKTHRAASCPVRHPWSAMTTARFSRAAGRDAPALDCAEYFLSARPEIAPEDFDFALWESSLMRAAKVLRTDIATMLREHGRGPDSPVGKLFRRIVSDPSFDAAYVRGNVFAWMLACGFIPPPLPIPVFRE